MSTDLTDLQLDKHGHFSLIKYADDGSIIIPVAKDMVDESPRAIGVVLDWTHRNNMKCNTSKCKKKKGAKRPFRQYKE